MTNKRVFVNVLLVFLDCRERNNRAKICTLERAMPRGILLEAYCGYRPLPVIYARTAY